MNSMPSLRIHLLVTDIGFVVYWLVTAFGALPPQWLFQDYANPLLVAWNWSFAPLDLIASFFGFFALHLLRRHNPLWGYAALASLMLTMCAGLMALSFWTIRGDFDIAWWLPNVYLLIWPLFFIRKMISPIKRGDMSVDDLMRDVDKDRTRK
jgi:hypothetical protein